MSTVAKTKKSTKPLSLDEFVKDKRRAEWRSRCPICRLSAEVQQLLKEGRRKKYTLADQAEWLGRAYRIKVTPADFVSHHSGRHEQ